MSADASGSKLDLTVDALPRRAWTVDGDGRYDESFSHIVNREDILAPDCSAPLSSSEVLQDVVNGTQCGGSCDGGDDEKADGENKLPFISRKLEDSEITALSGAFAGFVSGIVVCPLDVAKTRLQAQGFYQRARYYKGIFGTLTTIVHDEGMRGLYRGLVPIVLGYFPTWMIYFSIYEECKKTYPSMLESEFLSHSASALTAGAVCATVTNPIWVVKTRLMLQTAKNSHLVHYRGTWDAFRKMYKSEGLGVFYAGLVPSLFGLFHVAIHFPVYEKLKRWLHFDSMRQNCPRQIDHHQDLHLNRLVVASCASKMIASTITYPHEILRTRMQIRSVGEHYSIPKMVKRIYITEGLLGFYSGFTTNIVRTVPTSAITLISFEYFTRHFHTWNEKLAF